MPSGTGDETRVSGPEAIADRDYTTQQAADLRGMSINTLLSWERRYGVPNPRRNERGERVYTADDLAGIRWLQSETARGIPIGEAATNLLARGLPNAAEDVVVALDPARPTDRSRHPTVTAGRTEGHQADLIAALERCDRAAVSHLLAGFALESDPLLVAENVVLPAMRTLVRRVEASETDPAILDIGNHWIAGRLSAWLDAANPDRRDRRAVVLVVPTDAVTGEIVSLTYAIGIARRGDHVVDLPRGTALEAIVAVAHSTAASRIDLLVDDDTHGRTHRTAETRASLLRGLLPGIPVSVVAPDRALRPAEAAASIIHPGDDTAFPS